MKCTIAKNNELLLQQAIQHYRKSHQIFTFMSLYSDNEPYPIDEGHSSVRTASCSDSVRNRQLHEDDSRATEEREIRNEFLHHEKTLRDDEKKKTGVRQ